MATASKKPIKKVSKNKWKGFSGLKFIIPVAFIASFAVAGALYLASSHAASTYANGMCYQNVSAPIGVGICNPSLKVTTGGYTQPGQCYTATLNTPKTAFVYRPFDCTKQPFRVLCSQNIAGPLIVGACNPSLKITAGGYLEPQTCYNLVLNNSSTAYVYRPTTCTASFSAY